MKPVPGSKYRVVQPFRSAAGKDYEYGMILELFEETGQAPFGRASRISNWYVKCPYFQPPQAESVWSGIWNMIEFELIEPVK